MTNPSPLAVAVALGVGALAAGGGYLLYRELGGAATPMLPPPPPPDPDAELAEIVLMGATLAESPFVVDDVQQPIMLSTVPPAGEMSATGTVLVPEILVRTHGHGETSVAAANFGTVLPNGGTFDSQITAYDSNGQEIWRSGPVGAEQKAIAALVTDVTGDFARFAYEFALVRLDQDPDAWADDRKDETIASILVKIAPQIDWSQGLAPYTATDAAYTVWVATQLIGEVARQSVANRTEMF